MQSTSIEKSVPITVQQTRLSALRETFSTSSGLRTTQPVQNKIVENLKVDLDKTKVNSAQPSTAGQDNSDVNLAAKGAWLAPHSYVNEYIKMTLAYYRLMANTLEKRKEALDVLVKQGVVAKIRKIKTPSGREIEVILISISSLLENCGQFGHIGLGQAYGQPVAYIDSEYFDNETVIAHELYEIAQWEDKRDSLGLLPQEMRQWILDNNAEANRLAEQGHNQAPPLDELFTGLSVAVREQIQINRAQRIVNAVIDTVRGHLDQYNALLKARGEAEIEPIILDQQYFVYMFNMLSTVASGIEDKLHFLLDFVEELDDSELTWVIGHELDHRWRKAQEKRDDRKIIQERQEMDKAALSSGASTAWPIYELELTLGDLIRQKLLSKEEAEKISHKGEHLADEVGVSVLGWMGYNPLIAKSAYRKVMNFKSPNLIPKTDSPGYNTHPLDRLRIDYIRRAVKKYKRENPADFYPAEETDINLAAGIPPGYDVAKLKEELMGLVNNPPIDVTKVATDISYRIGILEFIAKHKKTPPKQVQSAINALKDILIYIAQERLPLDDDGIRAYAIASLVNALANINVEQNNPYPDNPFHIYVLPVTMPEEVAQAAKGALQDVVNALSRQEFNDDTSNHISILCQHALTQITKAKDTGEARKAAIVSLPLPQRQKSLPNPVANPALREQCPKEETLKQLKVDFRKVTEDESPELLEVLGYKLGILERLSQGRVGISSWLIPEILYCIFDVPYETISEYYDDLIGWDKDSRPHPEHIIVGHMVTYFVPNMSEADKQALVRFFKQRSDKTGIYSMDDIIKPPQIGKQAQIDEATLELSEDRSRGIVDVQDPDTKQRLGTIKLTKTNTNPVIVLEEAADTMEFEKEEHRQLLLAMVNFFKKSPPALYTFSTLIKDLFGFSSFERYLIALHTSLENNPVAIFHELGEHLVQLAAMIPGLPSFHLQLALSEAEGRSGNTLTVSLPSSSYTIELSPQTLDFIQQENWPDGWQTNPHYLLRVLQREIFKEEDEKLSQKIQEAQKPLIVDITQVVPLLTGEEKEFTPIPEGLDTLRTVVEYWRTSQLGKPVLILLDGQNPIGQRAGKTTLAEAIEGRPTPKYPQSVKNLGLQGLKRDILVIKGDWLHSKFDDIRAGRIPSYLLDMPYQILLDSIDRVRSMSYYRYLPGYLKDLFSKMEAQGQEDRIVLFDEAASHAYFSRALENEAPEDTLVAKVYLRVDDKGERTISVQPYRWGTDGSLTLVTADTFASEAEQGPAQSASPAIEESFPSIGQRVSTPRGLGVISQIHNTDLGLSLTVRVDDIGEMTFVGPSAERVAPFNRTSSEPILKREIPLEELGGHLIVNYRTGQLPEQIRLLLDSKPLRPIGSGGNTAIFAYGTNQAIRVMPETSEEMLASAFENYQSYAKIGISPLAIHRGKTKNGIPFMVVERIFGNSVNSLNRFLSETEIGWFLQLLDAMIEHRIYDVNFYPSSVMLDPNRQRALLADVKFAYVIPEGTIAATSFKFRMEIDSSDKYWRNFDEHCAIVRHLDQKILKEFMAGWPIGREFSLEELKGFVDSPTESNVSTFLRDAVVEFPTVLAQTAEGRWQKIGEFEDTIQQVTSNFLSILSTWQSTDETWSTITAPADKEKEGLTYVVNLPSNYPEAELLLASLRQKLGEKVNLKLILRGVDDETLAYYQRLNNALNLNLTTIETADAIETPEELTSTIKAITPHMERYLFVATPANPEEYKTNTLDNLHFSPNLMVALVDKTSQVAETVTDATPQILNGYFSKQKVTVVTPQPLTNDTLREELKSALETLRQV